MNYSCCNSEHLRDIDKYYGSIIKCIRDSTKFCVPVLNSSVNKYNVPGWTDLVKDKHNIARASFLEWVAAGKPRHGLEHQLMCRTRAEFKLTLRPCKAAEEQLRADARACQLAGNDSQALWKGVRKDSCKKATNHVNNVGHANGAQEVCGFKNATLQVTTIVYTTHLMTTVDRSRNFIKILLAQIMKTA